MAERCIGVDIGGTKVATAVLDGADLSTPKAVPTVTSSTEELLAQLAGAIDEAAAGDRDAIVGIGCPSVIDFATGTARSSVNIPLKDVPLRSALQERTGLPVVVDNDATVAALAEATDLATGRATVDNLIILTVGTGVGGGIVIGGRIYRGATGAAAELGHLIVAADLSRGAPAGQEDFPQPDSLEAHAAGGALGVLARARGFADGKACVAAAQAGDATAVDALRILGERLGVGIANLINAFDPDEVVVGGGVSAAGDLLLQPAIAVAWPLVLPGIGTATTIRIARHGNQAGVIGAALLARSELGAGSRLPR
ncbi:Glucokinase [Paraconexibacter sp. AEG42_29]|uniref:Glucokinase n=1 Tax=Paraconexibacter sp. AEG42_29 TaxID=2997339 RepID=A0AAU7B0Q8_9ACTN